MTAGKYCKSKNVRLQDVAKYYDINSDVFSRWFKSRNKIFTTLVDTYTLA